MSSPLLEQIEGNAITDLRLDDSDDEMIDNVRGLIEAMEKNTSIESVHFNGEFLGCLRGDNRSELLELIGGLPNLQEIKMGHSLLLVKVLSSMISKAKQLRVLSMTDIVFQGMDEDITACAMVLSTHPYLKEFEMNDCSAAAVKNASLEKLENAGKKLTSARAAGVAPEDFCPISAVGA